MSKILSTGTQQTGDTASSLSEKDIVNEIVKRLKKARTGWRNGFKSEAEVNGWKEELLIACVENNINSMALINKGLSEARRDKNPFFPPVGQFITWCLEEKEHFEHRRTLKADLEYRENQKRIGKKRATKETALNHIKTMRKGLTD
jgi:hypothetical protein